MIRFTDLWRVNKIKKNILINNFNIIINVIINAIKI